VTSSSDDRSKTSFEMALMVEESKKSAQEREESSRGTCPDFPEGELLGGVLSKNIVFPMRI
jgi:hypothetical protein